MDTNIVKEGNWMNKRFVMIFLFLVGFFPIVHQTLVWGYPFEFEDALHHEVLTLVSWSFAFGILFAGRYTHVKIQPSVSKDVIVI